MSIGTVLEGDKKVLQNEEISTWLLENGGPVIRYRTATELHPSDKLVDIKQLTDEMLQCQLVQEWLKNLIPPRLLLDNPAMLPPVLSSGIMEVHGSKTENLENVLGKLTDFGIRKGIAELDKRTLPYREWLEGIADRPDLHIFDSFSKCLVANFFARAGYTDEPAVVRVLRERLNTIYDFACKGDYDIYEPGKYVRKLPLIKLKVVKGGVC